MLHIYLRPAVRALACLVLAAALPASAWAGEQSKAPRDSFAKMRAAHEAGTLSRAEYMDMVLRGLRTPAQVPDAYRFETGETPAAARLGKAASASGKVFVPVKSGTPLFRELKAYYVEQGASMRDALAKSYRDEKIYESPDGHFYVHYSVSASDGRDAVANTDSDDHGQGEGTYNLDNAPDKVEDIADYFDTSWDVMVNQLGFDEPPLDGSTDGGTDKFDIYVRDIGAYGATYFYGSRVYIEVDNGSSEELDKVTAGHEFFHAIQANHGWKTGNWYIEGTAMLAEDTVYDSVNDYIEYSGNDFLDDPDTNLLDDDHNGYSAVLFWKFLIEKYGTGLDGRRAYLTADPDSDPDLNGLDILKAVYDQEALSDEDDIIDDVMLTEYGIEDGRAHVFREWLVANYAKDLSGNNEGWYGYLENDEGYNTVKTAESFTLGTSQAVQGTVNAWGADFIKVGLSQSSAPDSVTLTLKADDGVSLQVVPVDGDDAMGDVVFLVLDDEDDGQGSVELPNAGYDHLMCIVGGKERGRVSYTLTVSADGGTSTTSDVSHEFTLTPSDTELYPGETFGPLKTKVTNNGSVSATVYVEEYLQLPDGEIRSKGPRALTLPAGKSKQRRTKVKVHRTAETGTYILGVVVTELEGTEIDRDTLEFTVVEK